MDFASGFLDVKGFDAIMVMVDRFLKYGVFRPMPKNCTTKIAADEFYHNVVRLFGFPMDIIAIEIHNSLGDAEPVSLI